MPDNETDEDMYSGEPIARWSSVTLACLYAVSTLSGLCGSALTVFTLLSDKQFSLKTNTCSVYLSNLVATDLFVQLYYFPLLAVGLITGRHPVHDDTHCVINGLLFFTCSIVFMWTLTATSFDRYMYVCQRTAYHKLFSRGSSRGACLVMWLLSGLISLPSALDGTLGFDPKTGMCFLQHRGAFTLGHAVTVGVVVVTVVGVGVPNVLLYRTYRASRCRVGPQLLQQNEVERLRVPFQKESGTSVSALSGSEDERLRVPSQKEAGTSVGALSGSEDERLRVPSQKEAGTSVGALSGSEDERLRRGVCSQQDEAQAALRRRGSAQNEAQISRAGPQNEAQKLHVFAQENRRPWSERERAPAVSMVEEGHRSCFPTARRESRPCVKTPLQEVEESLGCELHHDDGPASTSTSADWDEVRRNQTSASPQCQSLNPASFKSACREDVSYSGSTLSPRPALAQCVNQNPASPKSVGREQLPQSGGTGHDELPCSGSAQSPDGSQSETTIESSTPNASQSKTRKEPTAFNSMQSATTQESPVLDSIQSATTKEASTFKTTQSGADTSVLTLPSSQSRSDTAGVIATATRGAGASHGRAGESQPSGRRSRASSPVVSRNDWVLLRSLLAIFLVFFLLTFPATVLFVLRGTVEVSPFLYRLAIWLYAVNSSVNWIIYGLMNSRFRQGYKRAFQKTRSCFR